MGYEVNKLQRDEFGRPSGVLAINKPQGLTSHDVVARVRRILETPRVGHAGALDPFATGLLLILVGKATKESDSFIGQDKEYRLRILFGISTDSADTEGKVRSLQELSAVPDFGKVLPEFVPGYDQFVPVYSSVKIDGQKLRVLARRYDRFEVRDEADKRIARFFRNDTYRDIELPKHYCDIPYIEILNSGMQDISDLDFWNENEPTLGNLSSFPTAELKMSCSKGTYIRSFAEDLGAALQPPLPSMLIELERTRIGKITIDQALTIDQLAEV